MAEPERIIDFGKPLWGLEMEHPGGVFSRVVNADSEEEAVERATQIASEAGINPVTIRRIIAYPILPLKNGGDNG